MTVINELLKDCIEFSTLSQRAIRKKIMKVLFVKKHITKVLDLTRDIMAYNFNPLNEEEVHFLIEELKLHMKPEKIIENNISINEAENNEFVINILKKKIRFLENELSSLRKQIKET